MTAYSDFVVPDREGRRRTPAKLDWRSHGMVISDGLGTPETTAIVHPRKFTSEMMKAAQRQDA